MPPISHLGRSVEASEPRTLSAIQNMKRRGEKIVAVVAWDAPLAAVAEQAGADIVSAGDSVGVNLWGRANPLDVTLDEMVLVCRAIRAGASSALISVDFPFGPLQEGEKSAVRAAIRLMREGGADIVKLDGAADAPEVVERITRAGIPVFAHFGLTPQTAARAGIDYQALFRPGADVPDDMTAKLVGQARRLESAGAALLDFQGSGPVAGPAVVEAVTVPVLGGQGGGPWLDGRIRMAHAALGYSASAAGRSGANYAELGQAAVAALREYAGDVRAGRQIRGAASAPSPAR